MIDLLVFSRDRAMQLDLLLRSLLEHGMGAFRPTVLYYISSPLQLESYDRLQGSHPGNAGVEWLRQQAADTFEPSVRMWLAGLRSELVAFLVDDDFFYRDFRPERLERGVPFTMRPGDFDYLFTLDGGIYRRDWLLELLEGRSFADPTRLEAGLASLVEGQAFETGRRSPCVVGVPDNRVSESSGMPAMHGPGRAEELARLYLQGFRIDMDELEVQVKLAGLAPHLNLSYSLYLQRSTV